MKLLHALVCKDILVDRDSGSTSYIKTFEHGAVRQFPAQVPPFYVGTLWELAPTDADPFTISLRLKAPSGETTPLAENKVTPTGSLMHRVNFALPGLGVKEEGRHSIQVLLRTKEKNSLVKDLPLHVFLQPARKDG